MDNIKLKNILINLKLKTSNKELNWSKISGNLFQASSSKFIVQIGRVKEDSDLIFKIINQSNQISNEISEDQIEDFETLEELYSLKAAVRKYFQALNEQELDTLYASFINLENFKEE